MKKRDQVLLSMFIGWMLGQLLLIAFGGVTSSRPVFLSFIIVMGLGFVFVNLRYKQ